MSQQPCSHIMQLTPPSFVHLLCTWVLINSQRAPCLSSSSAAAHKGRRDPWPWPWMLEEHCVFIIYTTGIAQCPGPWPHTLRAANSLSPHSLKSISPQPPRPHIHRLLRMPWNSLSGFHSPINNSCIDRGGWKAARVFLQWRGGIMRQQHWQREFSFRAWIGNMLWNCVAVLREPQSRYLSGIFHQHSQSQTLCSLSRGGIQSCCWQEFQLAF